MYIATNPKENNLAMSIKDTNVQQTQTLEIMLKIHLHSEMTFVQGYSL
jgi:hypothetical protein